MSNVKGYWTESYYVGFMQDGTKRYFSCEQDYKEAYDEDLDQDE